MIDNQKYTSRDRTTDARRFCLCVHYTKHFRRSGILLTMLTFGIFVRMAIMSFLIS